MTNSHRHSHKFKIIILDDHPIVRAGLAAVIAQDPGFIVVAECETTEEAIAAIRNTNLTSPSSILRSARPPPSRFSRRLQQDQPGLRVLALSMTTRPYSRSGLCRLERTAI